MIEIAPSSSTGITALPIAFPALAPGLSRAARTAQWHRSNNKERELTALRAAWA
jgi:hypothetical protein